MDNNKEWEKPELLVISEIETSENVLEWCSGPPIPRRREDEQSIP